MVKDHTYSERGNPLPPHWLLFPISSKGDFISAITPVVEYWLEGRKEMFYLKMHLTHFI